MIGPIVIDDVDIPNTACDDVMQRKVVIGLDGRIHCVYRRDPAAANPHIYYAYSDDRGETWTIEDPVPSLSSILDSPNIVVDSLGVPHILFRDVDGAPIQSLKYINRSGGTWSAPETFILGLRLFPTLICAFTIGEIVEGQTSGATATLLFWHSVGATKYIYVDPPTAPFQLGEWIRGQTSGCQGTYASDLNHDFDPPALAIDSEDGLHLAVRHQLVFRSWHAQKPYGGNWTHGTPTLVAFQCSEIAIGVDSNNQIHIIGVPSGAPGTDYRYCNGTFNSWNATELIVFGGTAHQPFSMGIDLDGNVHLVMQQTGLGGANPFFLNIHYYKRTAGVWGAVEHVTDDASPREDPSIAVDQNNNIRVTFRGTGYGVNAVNEDLAMREKSSGGAWGVIREFTDRIPAQYAPSMLHALFPKQSRGWGTYRPNCPDGWACIFNGQQSLDVEYLSEIEPPPEPEPELGEPYDLLCEQKRNPTDVTDPKPEFSAIHRVG